MAGAVQPSLRIGDSPAFASARNALLDQIERASGEVAKLKARRDSNKRLRKALEAWRRGETARAAKFALEATELDEQNAQAFCLLAVTLDKLGHVHKALVSYERAFQLDPGDSDLVLNLGLTAWNVGNLKGAEKMFRLYIDICPERPEGYNNLASVIRDRGAAGDAIELLKLAIYRMPQEAMLWNTLASVLAEAGRAEESLVFYREALRLDPEFARVWHNLGYSYMHLGRLEEALDVYDAALKTTENHHERIEARHSRSICLIGMGRLEEGFREYEIRNDKEFRAYVLHYTKAPLWNGEDLSGKRILLIGEQGLGDEFMFANIVPDLIRAAGAQGKVQIAVDRRAIPLFARSFPEAEIGTYESRKIDGLEVRICPWALKDGDPDFYAPLGTPLQFLRKRVEDFPREAFFKADPQRTRAYRSELEAAGPGPYIGICWRSMVIDPKRKKYYSAIEAWKPVLTAPGVRFANLQYGDVAAELAQAEESLGVRVHRFDGLDLKNDLDGAAAATAACDLVISAPTSSAAMAGALGKPVWFLTASRVWPQLGTDRYPWYRDSRVFACEKFADWDALMPRLRGALVDFAKG